MTTLDENAQMIEDLFSQRGLPTRVILDNAFGEARHEVVFPMGEEGSVSSSLGDASRLLRVLLGEESAQLVPRTILFHCAYELFSELHTPTVFRSINIGNVSTPKTQKREFKRKPGPLPSNLLKTRWKGIVNYYDMDVVFVSTDRNAANLLVSPVRKIATTFNRASRFLKVDELRWGWTPTRTVTAELEFKHISIAENP